MAEIYFWHLTVLIIMLPDTHELDSWQSTQLQALGIAKLSKIILSWLASGVREGHPDNNLEKNEPLESTIYNKLTSTFLHTINFLLSWSHLISTINEFEFAQFDEGRVSQPGLGKIIIQLSFKPRGNMKNENRCWKDLG